MNTKIKAGAVAAGALIACVSYILVTAALVVGCATPVILVQPWAAAARQQHCTDGMVCGQGYACHAGHCDWVGDP
jgi:hypothetical protein